MDISDGLKRAYQGVSKGASSINEWGEGVSNKMANAQFEDGALNILPTLNNPGQAAKRFGSWFNDQINTAAGYSDPYDNPNPLLAPSRDKQAEAGLNLAGLLQTGAMPFAPKSAGGTVGTFIGPKAANWDSQAAEKAAQLLDDGVDPAQVWKEHLIGRMPDNALFSEIDDSGAKFNLANAPIDAYGAKELPIFEALKHNKAKTSYPSEADLMAIHFPNEDYNGASFIPDERVIQFGNEAMKNGKSVALHELQHAIQQREGWARGGSHESFSSDIKALNELNTLSFAEMDDFQKAMFKQLKDQYGTAKTNTEAYQRLTGEAQARATQDRMNLNMDERRNSYPLAGDKLSDIPLKNLINRY